MSRFEHKMMRFEPHEIDKAFDAIENMGGDGWELVNGQAVVEPDGKGNQKLRIYQFWKREAE